MKNALFLLLALSILSSCGNFNKDEIKGNGNVITKKGDSGSFDAINVTDGLDVYVTMGEKENIEIQADDNLMEYIKAEVKSGILKIYIDGNANLNMDNVKIDVIAVELSQINASADSDVIVENTIKSELFSCDVSSAAEVELSIETGNLSANASSAGEIDIKGKADEASLNASSTGEIDGDDLKVMNCDAGVSSGGEVNIYVSGDLSASASSSGEVNVKGNPTLKKMNTSSGGKINKD